MSTDSDWERWGRENPYFGVYSAKKFLGKNISSDARSDFFDSGVRDIDRVMSAISKLNGGKPPVFKQALDFGCGVGRLTVPLSRFSRRTTGLDVSPSMIRTAKRNLTKSKPKGINYVVDNGALAKLPSYDMVHSYIVLQHIPPHRGEVIIDKLLAGLVAGGWAALHVTYAHDASRARRLVIRARSFLPLHYALNVARGRPLKAPLMRMHLYDLPRVLRIFADNGVEQHITIATNHGGYRGLLIIGQKPAVSSTIRL